MHQPEPSHPRPGDRRPAPLGLAFVVVAIAGVAPACLLPSNGDSGDGMPDEEHGAAPALSLVAHDRWQPTDAANDILAEHRPPRIDCPAQAWRREGSGLEVDTGACNYLSLSQPIALDLAAGDTLGITVWWDALASVEPAEGHLAVIIAGEVVWQEFVAIPGPAGIREGEVALPHAVAAGDIVTLHLHNHGYNTWRFEEINILTAR